ncbi:TlpA disulfide reductase family protein [Alteribacter keqinensis]|uniref:TlpA family protein disulfide reductase n=1 Tax=Alteribacter keqinensis TaxID=2483800 RepID=A0A3M7TUZ0_9BACI|nr:TlpA disulfide reductase family protein [Alteribacter keqinensis]RNA69049.1 TlpA family protein disulfide reductase [Alteribacter keqinensis]
MKGKHLSSVLILTAAMLVAAYVVYDHRSDTQGNDPLDEYLENEGIDVADEGEVPDYEEVDETGVRPGMLLKDISLPVWDEEEKMSISDFRGDYVVLNIWATWCPPCREEMPELIKFQEDYGDDGVQVVGINNTTQEPNEETVGRFIDEFNISFPTLMARNNEVTLDYQVIAMPLTYILDPDGRIIIRHTGYLDYGVLEEFLGEAKEKYEEKGEASD